MHSSEEVPNGRTDCNELKDRAVTDSVHERFRALSVQCATCNIQFVGNRKAIEKHFNDLHPSKTQCKDCQGKIFVYQQILPGENGERRYEEIVYHKCQKS